MSVVLMWVIFWSAVCWRTVSIYQVAAMGRMELNTKFVKLLLTCKILFMRRCARFHSFTLAVCSKRSGQQTGLERCLPKRCAAVSAIFEREYALVRISWLAGFDALFGVCHSWRPRGCRRILAQWYHKILLCKECNRNIELPTTSQDFGEPPGIHTGSQ